MSNPLPPICVHTLQMALAIVLHCIPSQLQLEGATRGQQGWTCFLAPSGPSQQACLTDCVSVHLHLFVASWLVMGELQCSAPTGQAGLSYRQKKANIDTSAFLPGRNFVGRHPWVDCVGIHHGYLCIHSQFYNFSPVPETKETEYQWSGGAQQDISDVHGWDGITRLAIIYLWHIYCMWYIYGKTLFLRHGQGKWFWVSNITL